MKMIISEIIMILSRRLIMPDFFLRPVYRISPFKTADYSKTIRALNEKNNNQSVINKIKNGYFQYFTASGRQAIFIYLEYLNLKKMMRLQY